MDNRSYVAGIVAPILLCVFSLNVYAFVPNGWKATLTSGYYHEEMTLAALDEIYAAYGYGPRVGVGYTKNMKKVRKLISEKNARVDEEKETWSDPLWHCDGEVFLNQCSDNIKKVTEQSIRYIKSGELDKARILVGKINHPIQDFYSHSNWVENSGITINPYLGKSHFPNLASLGEDTCRDISQVCTTRNMITKNLTSGYYLGSTGYPPSGGKKCFHGGFSDKLGRQGINKDSGDCNSLFPIAAHASLHYDAAKAAILATIDHYYFLRSQLNDQEFKAFLGFDSNQLFAMNMSANDQPTHRAFSVEADQKDKLKITNDGNELLFALKKKTLASPRLFNSSSATNCTKLSTKAVYQAVSQTERNGGLFIFSEGDVNDAANNYKINKLAAKKNIRMMTAVSDQCVEENAISTPMARSYSTDRNTSQASSLANIPEPAGDTLFIVNPEEVEGLLQLNAFFADDNAIDLLSVQNKLKNTTDNHSFIIDSVTEKVAIYLNMSGVSTAITLKSPSGEIINASSEHTKLIKVKNGVIYIITQPIAGVWQATIQGNGEYKLGVAGVSSLELDRFELTMYDGRIGHESYFVIHNDPIANKRHTLIAQLSEKTTDVIFEFRTKAGKVIRQIALEPNMPAEEDSLRYISENVAIPDQPFLVYAIGKDKNGAIFQRVNNTLIEPQTLSLSVPVEIGLQVETANKYIFRVTNHGNTGQFIFSALDDSDYVETVTPASAELAQHESINVYVTLFPPASSKIGARNTLIFAATPEDADDTNRDITAGNYAMIESMVVNRTSLGDVNQDGEVNCFDLLLISNSMGNKAGDTAFNPLMDVNSDALIDIKDLAVVSRHLDFNVKCSQ